MFIKLRLIEGECIIIIPVLATVCLRTIIHEFLWLEHTIDLLKRIRAYMMCGCICLGVSGRPNNTQPGKGRREISNRDVPALLEAYCFSLEIFEAFLWSGKSNSKPWMS